MKYNQYMDSVDRLIASALEEDIGTGDITTLSVIDKDRRAYGRYIAKEDGILCGMDVVEAVFHMLDGKCIGTNFLSNIGLRCAINNKANKQLPVKTTDGYAFVETIKWNTAKDSTIKGVKYDFVFEPRFEKSAYELLKDYNDYIASGVNIAIRVTWKKDGQTRHQDFVYGQKHIETFFNSYNTSTGKFGQVFTLIVNSDLELTYEAVVLSDTGVELKK